MSTLLPPPAEAKRRAFGDQQHQNTSKEWPLSVLNMLPSSRRSQIFHFWRKNTNPLVMSYIIRRKSRSTKYYSSCVVVYVRKAWWNYILTELQGITDRGTWFISVCFGYRRDRFISVSPLLLFYQRRKLYHLNQLEINDCKRLFGSVSNPSFQADHRSWLIKDLNSRKKKPIISKNVFLDAIYHLFIISIYLSRNPINDTQKKQRGKGGKTRKKNQSSK